MNYIKSGNSYTVIFNGQVFTFDKSHKRYEDLVEALKLGDEVVFIDKFNEAEAVVGWSYKAFKYVDGQLLYGSEVVDDSVVSIIEEMRNEGFDCNPILNFLDKLYQNPANHVVTELYKWLAHRSLAITPDGDFLAYKSVSVYDGSDFKDEYGRLVKKGDLVDSYTKKIRNNPGDTNEMPRRLVNDNRDIACSTGYHVGTMKYITEHYKQDRTIICQINPADVVSVPSDCNDQKIRCCKYTVISEMKRELKIVEHNYKEEYYQGQANAIYGHNPEDDDCDDFDDECDSDCEEDCDCGDYWSDWNSESEDDEEDDEVPC